MKLIPVATTTCSSIYLLDDLASVPIQHRNIHAPIIHTPPYCSAVWTLINSGFDCRKARRGIWYIGDDSRTLQSCPVTYDHSRLLCVPFWIIKENYFHSSSVPVWRSPTFSPPRPNRVLILCSVSMDRKNDRRQWKRTEGRQREKKRVVSDKNFGVIPTPAEFPRSKTVGRRQSTRFAATWKLSVSHTSISFWISPIRPFSRVTVMYGYGNERQCCFQKKKKIILFMF